jgi:hypothetical protein
LQINVATRHTIVNCLLGARRHIMQISTSLDTALKSTLSSLDDDLRLECAVLQLIQDLDLLDLLFELLLYLWFLMQSLEDIWPCLTLSQWVLLVLLLIQSCSLQRLINMPSSIIVTNFIAICGSMLSVCSLWWLTLLSRWSLLSCLWPSRLGSCIFKHLLVLFSLLL